MDNIRLLRVSWELAMTEELSWLMVKLTSGIDDCFERLALAMTREGI
jgi:hypothetical protein